MNERDHILILKSLAGETSTEEEQLVQRRLDDDEFRREFEAAEALTYALRKGRYDSFGPSFVDRTLERIDRESEGALFPSIGEVMGRIFARFAPVGVALALILGVLNLTSAEEGVSTLEAALGLEPVDLASGYNAMLTELDPIELIDLEDE